MLSLLQKYRSVRTPQWRRVLLSTLAVLSGIAAAQTAFASNITVASPVNGTTSQSPLWIRAHNVGCNGLTPTAFGFSVDGSATVTTGATPNDIDVIHFAIANGTHTIHFKGWTSAGMCPIVDSTVNVGGSSASNTSSISNATSNSTISSSTSTSIPSNAVASSDLDTSSNWGYEHDKGTPGSSSGSTSYPATTPLYDNAREFYMTYSNRGGERWHNSFARDTNAQHFVLDTYVYIVNPSQLANLELDLNQVMSNGKTVIFGTQCSVYSHSWEWAYVSGGPHWHSSNVYCDPTKWAANTWHHLQIGFHRDSSGYVTHDWVNFDNNSSNFSGASAGSAQSLGWATGDLLMNIQMDGYSSSGYLKAYFHKTVFYRW
jgi:hypothetical protein